MILKNSWSTYEEIIGASRGKVLGRQDSELRQFLKQGLRSNTKLTTIIAACKELDELLQALPMPKGGELPFGNAVCKFCTMSQ